MAKPKLKKAVKVLYVKALRSNKFQQGKRKLKCMGRHCALGVLAELYEQSKGRELPDDYLGWYPKPAVWKWAGLLKTPSITINNVKGLISFHNDQGVDFKTIADAVEKQL